MKKLAFVLVALLLASSALAQPATQQGADRLNQVFQTYLGQGAQVVSVTANGDVYDLTIDAQPLIALGQDAGALGSVTPLELQLIDHGDGTWGVSLDQAISIDLSMPKALDLHEKWRYFCLFGKSGNFLPVTGFFDGF